MTTLIEKLQVRLNMVWWIAKATICHFRKDHCTETASALTYVTLLSIVPVATVVFVIVQDIPMMQAGLLRLENVLISAFAPDVGEDVIVYLHRFVERSNQLTHWSVIILLITVFWAFSTIEKTFNRIWNVPQSRRTWIRWLTYFLLIIFGPLILVFGVSMTIMLSSQYMAFPFTTIFSEHQMFYIVFLFMISFVVFMCLYRWIPNQRVAWGFAVCGGIIAAILFELSKRIFTIYLAWFPTHEVIYGAVALLPILMIWLHLVWSIILLGAEVCFSCEEYNKKHINI